MIDIKDTYGISLQAAIISAIYYGIITPECKRWWHGEYLENNPWEKENRALRFPWDHRTREKNWIDNKRYNTKRNIDIIIKEENLKEKKESI